MNASTETTTNTYRVVKNGRKIPNKVFDTYEKARQFVRKRVRSARRLPGYVPIAGSPSYNVDQSGLLHRTPSLGLNNYSITKQASACQRVEV